MATTDELSAELRNTACPPIAAALPPWPSKAAKRAVWIGLHRDEFSYTHYPSHSQLLEAARSPRRPNIPADAPDARRACDLYCVPLTESRRLESILTSSKGGSVLVTGYRGTGKSSLVNYTIARLTSEERVSRQADGDDSRPLVTERDPKNRSWYVPIRINLSTSRTAESLVLLMIKELHACSEANRFSGEERQEVARVYRKFLGTTISSATTGKDEEISGAAEIGSGGALTLIGKAKGSLGYGRQLHTSEGHAFHEHAYTLHEAQSDINHCIRIIRDQGYRVVFIFDEVDKLIPQGDTTHAPYHLKLAELQQIVSDLKFLITEADSFNIFVAGKDADDSWQEDQNKGEGLLESGFVQNIYVPSTLSAELTAAAGPQRWIVVLYRLWKAFLDRENPSSASIGAIKLTVALRGVLAELESEPPFPSDDDAAWTHRVLSHILSELGVNRGHWTFNTGLIVLPHISTLQLWRVLMRRLQRELEQTDTNSGDEDIEMLAAIHKSENPSDAIAQLISNTKKLTSLTERRDLLRWLIFIDLASRITSESFDPEAISQEHTRRDDDLKLMLQELRDFTPAQPMTERRSRRIRYLLQYLTFKGRGIPRKILREFYALVRHRSVIEDKDESYWKTRGDITHLVHAPTAVRQKMKFFASIVARLDDNQDFLRGLDDKGSVATFHIIDYILKYFETGFTWDDIEQATIMTRREELFPSRQLVVQLLEILEDHVIERVDRRHRRYMLLPRVRHDLAELYLAFGPEQIELRFTQADFATEIEHLRTMLSPQGPFDRASSTGTLPTESFKIQLRLARIQELLGNHQNARLEYSKALRWIRSDLTQVLGTDYRAGGAIQSNTAITYICSAIEALWRLGYLYEKERSFRTSLHYYQSATSFCEATWELARDDKVLSSSILGRPLEIEQLRYPDGSIVADYVAEEVPQETDASRRRKDLDRDLQNLVEQMVPHSAESDHPFTHAKGFVGGPEAEFRHHPVSLHTALGPYEFGDLMNMIAIGLEKLWHRYGANRFLLLALDYYSRTFDEFNSIDQMIFIAELLIRRRDVRLATNWLLLALRRVGQYQRSHDPDRMSKQPELRSSLRAKLFEYLGDIYYATQGTAIIASEELEKVLASLLAPEQQRPSGLDAENSPEETPDVLGKAVEAAMTGHRGSFRMGWLDHRDSEYFYTQAAYFYGMNQQPLRQVDVSIKKLIVRQRELRSHLEAGRFTGVAKRSEIQQENNQAAATDVDPRLANELFPRGEAIRTWCSFWQGAERTLSSLLISEPRHRRSQSLDRGRIVDRRRFGELFTIMGEMLVMAAQEGIGPWYWDAKDLEKHYWTNEARDAYVAEEVSKYRERFGASSDDSEGKGTYHDLDNDCGNLETILIRRTSLQKAQDSIDRIFGFLTDNPAFEEGRAHQRDYSVICSRGAVRNRSSLWNMSSTQWRSLATSDRNTGTDQETSSVATWGDHPNMFLTGQLYFLLERLLGDEEEENSSHLREQRLKVRTLYRAEVALLGAHLSLDDNIRDIELAKASAALGFLYLDCIVELLEIRRRETTEEPEDQQDSVVDASPTDANTNLDQELAQNYCLLHLAAKRFLVYAIDILRAERQRERCTYSLLGKCYQALAELMVIRSEVLEYAESAPTNDGITLGGLHRQWPAALTAIRQQSLHIADRHVQDVRSQAAHAFREACRQYLSEIEEYTKRYRFPNEVFVLHRNVMDRRLHFDICASIYARHWNYGNAKPPAAQKAAQDINEVARRLGVALFDALPRVHVREAWLSDMQELFDLVDEMSTQRCRLKISGGREVTIRPWRSVNESKNEPRHFFRTYDDGLGVSASAIVEEADSQHVPEGEPGTEEAKHG